MSVKPLGERIRALRDAQGFSRAVLRDAIVAAGGSISETYIHKIEEGKKQPGDEALVAILSALGASYEHFPEFRLALARRQLDERVVGMEAALEAAELFSAAVGENLAAGAAQLEGPGPGAPGQRTGGGRSGSSRRRRGRRS